MKLIAMDVETSGTLNEYALQPYRAKTGDAWLTSIAWHGGLGEVPNYMQKSYREKPDIDDIRRGLLWCARNNVRIVGWNTAFDVAWLIALGLRDEVFACKWLDSMLIYRHLYIKPTHTNDTRSYSLKAAVGWFLPKKWHGYESGVDFFTRDDAELRKLRRYNKLDSLFTHHITVDHLLKSPRMSPTLLKTILVEAESIPLVAEAMVEGLCIDTDAAEELDTLLEETAAAKTAVMVFTEPDFDAAIVRSPKKMEDLIINKWKLRPSKLTNKGKYSFDRESLLEMAPQDDRVRALSDIREAEGNRVKFAQGALESAEYNGDGCSRPAPRIFGTYCVPGDVEVLTREGWVALKDWAGGDIMQVDEHMHGKFLPATKFVGPVASDWVKVKTQKIDCLFTMGHTVPYLAQKTGEFTTCKAGELLGGKRSFDIPIACYNIDGLDMAEWQVRLIVAAQADGYYSNKGLRFTLKKQRKVDRIKWLLNGAGIMFREYVCPSYPDRTEITVTKTNLPAWLQKDKKFFGPYLLSVRDKAAFIDELRYWDGSETTYGCKYATSVKENAEWVKTIASLCGVRCGVSTSNGMWLCTISEDGPRAISSVKSHRHVTEIQHTEQAFCAETKTGYWLARSKGTVFVTGNTGRMTYSSKQGRGKAERPTGIAIHQWKRDPTFRRIIKAPKGYKLVEFDFAGQEFRWMAVMSGDRTMLSLCQPGEDAHAYMGAMIKGLDYKTLMAAVHAGDKEAKAARQLGKVANLSLQYQTSARRLISMAAVQHGVKLTYAEASRIHSTYRNTYPGVPGYWSKQKDLCRRTGLVYNLAGRSVSLTDRSGTIPSAADYPTQSTAVNFPIQSMGADQKYLGLAVMKKICEKYGARFYLELHDGLFFVVPEEHADEFIQKGARALSNLPYEKIIGDKLTIKFPVDAKVGDSWGNLKEVEIV